MSWGKKSGRGPEICGFRSESWPDIPIKDASVVLLDNDQRVEHVEEVCHGLKQVDMFADFARHEQS